MLYILVKGQGNLFDVTVKQMKKPSWELWGRVWEEKRFRHRDNNIWMISHGCLFYFLITLCSLSGPDQPAKFLSRKCLIITVCLLELFWESPQLHFTFRVILQRGKGLLPLRYYGSGLTRLQAYILYSLTNIWIYNTQHTPFMMINYCIYFSVCVFLSAGLSKEIVLDIVAMLFTPLWSVKLTSCRLCGWD